MPSLKLPNVLWGQEEIMEALGCGTSRIISLRKLGAPIAKIRGYLLAHRQTLDEWIREITIESVEIDEKNDIK